MVAQLRSSLSWRCVTTLIPLLIYVGTSAGSENSDWVSRMLPPKLVTFDVGTSISVHGLPMRLTGFVLKMSAPETIQMFKQTMGQPMVENKLGPITILGKGSGDEYLTVQIEPSARGSRGTIAVTNLKEAAASATVNADERQVWRNRLPSGTQLMSLMKSSDGPRISQTIIYSNEHSLQLNADRLKNTLLQDGLDEERVSTVEPPAGSRMTEGQALYFRGVGKDAMATIHRNEKNKTFVVLSLTSYVEVLK
jgi:hypothetical protein